MCSDAANAAYELPPDKRAKIEAYRLLNHYALRGQTVCTGSSLMEFCPIHELQQTFGPSFPFYNRGAAGFVTRELLAALDECVLELEPSRLFINIGTNDIGEPDYTLPGLIGRYEEILKRVQQRLPDCRIVTLAYYPVNADDEFAGVDRAAAADLFSRRSNRAIREANEAVADLSRRLGIGHLDVNAGLADDTGNLDKAYTMDGIHLYANGYKIVWDNLSPYL
ncbi:GDSL-type esterase/lipase family protein [Saccharibacillus qingshengii]|uniref:GDSL-type esterase/lipase family protein n=1 Tax=Saccharibacillus qingshengii TaxID=1763540 RepID=UPI001551B1B7|nr:GDSL-type esterase/lipase family protein [Saccharibacillus qingshengii]